MRNSHPAQNLCSHPCKSSSTDTRDARRARRSAIEPSTRRRAIEPTELLHVANQVLCKPKLIPIKSNALLEIEAREKELLDKMAAGGTA
jgi:hypothetical protein